MLAREKAKKIIRLCKKEIIELNTDNDLLLRLYGENLSPENERTLKENNAEIDLLMSIIGDFNYSLSKEGEDDE